MTGSLLVGRDRATIVVAVVGLGSMHGAYQLQEHLDGEGPDVRAIRLDLSDCAGVDSTFMGVLAGFQARGISVSVHGAGPRAREQMEAVGLEQVIEIREGAPAASTPALAPLAPLALPSELAIPLVERAHRALASSSEEAERLYRPFLERLQEERRKLRKG